MLIYRPSLLVGCTNISQISYGKIMPSLKSKLCLLLFVTSLSVAQFAAVDGPVDSLWNFPYDELESQVPAVDSTIGDNQFLASPGSVSEGTLTSQDSNGCKPPQDHHPVKMRSKRDWCPNTFVDPRNAPPGQDPRPTSQTDSRPNANGSPKPNGQANRTPIKQPWWQKFINLGNEIEDPKPCKHYRPFAVCAPPFDSISALVNTPLIQFCRLCTFHVLGQAFKISKYSATKTE